MFSCTHQQILTERVTPMHLCRLGDIRIQTKHLAKLQVLTWFIQVCLIQSKAMIFPILINFLCFALWAHCIKLLQEEKTCKI